MIFLLKVVDNQMFGNQNANLKLFGLNGESFWLKAVKPSFLSLSMDNTHLLCIVLFLLSITHQGYCVTCKVLTLLEFRGCTRT